MRQAATEINHVSGAITKGDSSRGGECHRINDVGHTTRKRNIERAAISQARHIHILIEINITRWSFEINSSYTVRSTANGSTEVHRAHLRDRQRTDVRADRAARTDITRGIDFEIGSRTTRYT